MDTLNDIISGLKWGDLDPIEAHDRVLALFSIGKSLPPDVAEKILKVRDAYVANDMEDVWHHLYSIASPNFDELEPWEELEKIAGRL